MPNDFFCSTAKYCVFPYFSVSFLLQLVPTYWLIKRVLALNTQTFGINQTLVFKIWIANFVGWKLSQFSRDFSEQNIKMTRQKNIFCSFCWPNWNPQRPIFAQNPHEINAIFSAWKVPSKSRFWIFVNFQSDFTSWSKMDKHTLKLAKYKIIENFYVKQFFLNPKLNQCSWCWSF